MSGGVLSRLLQSTDDLGLFEGIAKKAASQKGFVDDLFKMKAANDPQALSFIDDLTNYARQLGDDSRAVDRSIKVAYDSLKLSPYKYGTFDDFVAPLGKPVYHGTDNNFDTFSLRNFGSTDDGFLGKGVYLSGRKGNAKQYGSNVMESYIPGFNPYRYQDSYTFGAFSPDRIRETFGLPANASADDLTNAILGKGYNGVAVDEVTGSGRMRPNEEVVAFDPRSVYTKQYLQDIYNQSGGY